MTDRAEDMFDASRDSSTRAKDALARNDREGDGARDARLKVGATEELGPNFERLEELRPELVNALRDLVRQYREEGIVARRH